MIHRERLQPNAADAPLRLVPDFDPATGELRTTDCSDCVDLAAKVAGLERALEANQDELTKTLTHLKALKTSRERDRTRDKRRAEVEEVFEDWKEKTGKKRSKLTADRHDVIAARLTDEYTVGDFKLANLGAAHDPWTRSGEEPMREIATFAKKGAWLEDYANRGARWLKRQREPKQALESVPEQAPSMREVAATARAPAPTRALDGRSPIDRVLTAFPADNFPQPRSLDRWEARCPAHNGGDRNLVITRFPNGTVGLKCWSHACEPDTVAEALGLRMTDLFEGSDRDDNARAHCLSGPTRENRDALRMISEYLRGADRELESVA